ncbi:MAG: AAA family ATPase [Candidatus Micrarchaeota archaeon]|nr:AAA family ATPase [Candidatus Micrarchaeota archaeon]
MPSSEVKPNLSSLVGNPSAITAAKAWAQGWQEGKRQPPLLVTGSTGTGKTALAHALANEFGWELFEFNASDLRDEESVSTLLANAASSASLFGGTRLILIDDADSLSGAADRGGAGAMAKAIAGARQPVILTASDYYDKKLSSIKAHCTRLELRRAHFSTIAKLLRQEAASRGIVLAEGDAEKIAQAAAGDIRAALNDLRARNMSASRDREKNIFDVMRDIFKSEKYAEARKAAFSSDVDHDMLKLWIAQNLPAVCIKPFDLAEGYGNLSRADVFDGRIKRAQYWGYLRYSSDLMTSGVALSKSAPAQQHGYVQFAYPDYIRAMGSSKSARTLRKGALSKITRMCHCSLQQASGYLPLFELVAKKEEGAFGGLFDEDELAFIMRKPVKKAAARKKAAD